jgi:hypothetical protein
MEKHYYNAASLERVLLALERRYGRSSAEVYDAHLAGDPLAELSGFARHCWISFYRDYRRLSEAGFAENAERLLAPA